MCLFRPLETKKENAILTNTRKLNGILLNAEGIIKDILSFKHFFYSQNQVWNKRAFLKGTVQFNECYLYVGGEDFQLRKLKLPLVIHKELWN